MSLCCLCDIMNCMAHIETLYFAGSDEILIQIRLARISDALELKKLNDLFNGVQSNTVEMIERSLEENKQEIVCVASQSGGNANKLVGFCCGQIIRSMCYSILYGDITEFFVIEEYRCQDSVEARLIEQIESEFDKRGVNHLHHIIGRDNLQMQELYCSLGYTNSSLSSYGSSSIMIFEKDTDSRIK